MLRKTLIDLTTPRGTLAAIMAGVLLPALVFWGCRGGAEALTQQMRVHYMVGLFFSICFIWTLGLLAAVVVSAKAADFVAKERSEGSLLLLVSRPIDRRWIIAARLAALVIYAVLLETVTLLLVDLVAFFLMRGDTDILLALLRATMWMIPYVVLITAVFGSIAIALSSLMRARIMALMSLFIAAVFLSGMVVTRVSSMEGGSDRPFHMVDMGYHLGNILIPLERKAEGGHIIVTSGHWLIVWDLYASSEEQIPSTGHSDFSIDPASYCSEDRCVGSWYSLGMWLVVIGGSLGIAAVAVERKDVD